MFTARPNKHWCKIKFIDTEVRISKGKQQESEKKERKYALHQETDQDNDKE